MQQLVESLGAVHDAPYKGHDRLYLDDDNLFYGVFDGAGGDELSQAIIDHLPSVIAKHTAQRERSPATFLAHVVSEIDLLSEGADRKSTGAIACISKQPGNMRIHYANAGDSSIYLYDSGSNRLRLLAHTPTNSVRSGGYTYIDTTEFLGAGRTPEETANLVGELILPNTVEWTLAGMTDGVIDDDGQGIATRDLETALRSNNTQAIPLQILASYEYYDDAAVFVVRH